ncbi:unnamed protein product [Adineta ricciae]|uniref:NEL domain-containing protein n=1 Tax=Adineta ricciae TaxID=249248 RepID=A0A813Z2C5_ADIRI|nr:unnamed protein product [Adineta ricciae]CAF1302046.1 unnamed protein product [Adineta ricciae]
MIRGTSIRLQHRQNPAVLRRTRANKPSNEITTTQLQIVTLPTPPQPQLTLSELIESLETWRDPDDSAQDLIAKERIQDCFEQQSDSLDLSSLSLSTLPDAIGRMQHIQFLSLANNCFSELPEILVQLTDLKLLNLSYNTLVGIPDSIKLFEKLQFLNVSCNQLQKVSAELARLPHIETVLLPHNRILEFPDNIKSIKALEIHDQVPFARVDRFSVEFAKQWEATIKHEGDSGYFEIWMARFEEILKLEHIERYADALQGRVGKIMNLMVKSAQLRQRCFIEANKFIATCYDGLLFSLFVMETIYLEEKMMILELSDDEVRQAMEQIYNFRRLQDLAILYARKQIDETTTTERDAEIVELEASLLFYSSSANTLDMPLDKENSRFINDVPRISLDVQMTVQLIEQEKREAGEDYLVDYLIDKEVWVFYLEVRYADIIAEHTGIFMEQLDELEARKSTMLDYDYLVEANALVEEKTDSEQRLYRQLTKNIVKD